jgi:transcriptional regulator with XRE-family HTH domain
MEETLGRRIRRARLRLDITQKDLAGRTKISRTAMNLLEKGDTADPRMSTLMALADVLGVTMDYLAGREEDKESEHKPAARATAGRRATPVG